MIIIYTDGAARGNPGKAGWGVVVVDKEHKSVVEFGGASVHATNNQMELTAASKALEYVSKNEQYRGQKIALYTDSSYVINGMKKWIHGWQKNRWQTSQKKEVENKRLWEELATFSIKKDIEWLYVPGHAGVPLNERTDFIATNYADNKKVDLFIGLLENYTYDITPTAFVKQATPKSKKSTGGYYIVIHNKNISRYETWKECENAVKGSKGVRFKKVQTKDEEQQFIDSVI